MTAAPRSQYRWTILAAGCVAQTGFAAFVVGLPVLAPALQDEYDVTLEQIGAFLTLVSLGILVTVLAWGLAADRFGERAVLLAGLGTCGCALLVAAWVSWYPALVAVVTCAAGLGVAVNSASGSVVMRWFPMHELGFALGIRQTSITIGGVLAAFVLPSVVHAGGLRGAFLTLGGFCLAGAVGAAAVIGRGRARGGEHAASPAHRERPRLRDAGLLRLSLSSCLYVVPQAAVMGFVVLFLTEERGMSTGIAAAVLGCAYFAATVGRIGAGRWSDSLGRRVTPLRWFGLSTSLGLAIVALAALVDMPTAVLVPLVIVASASSMAWNGLSLTAAAELGGRHRSGAAIGVQQTFLGIGATATPIVFAMAVAATSWGVAFGLVAVSSLGGWWLLRPLAD
ncbi:MAG TPA: MFS transporter [Gaiella sp.]